MATGGGAVQFGHPIVHQDDVRLMPVVGLNGLDAGANHFYDFVLAMRDKRRQRRSHTFLVVSDEYAHAEFGELFMPDGGKVTRLRQSLRRGRRVNELRKPKVPSTGELSCDSFVLMSSEHLVNVSDYAYAAREKLPKDVLGYYEGGALDEIT